MKDTQRTELQQNFRADVLETLELLASKKQQLEYQKNVPIAYVSAELFNQWDDCYKIPKDQDWYQAAFSKAELAVLAEFDREFDRISKATPEYPPDITLFVDTPEWNALSSAALRALARLNEI
jgi:hypothetical protein